MIAVIIVIKVIGWSKVCVMSCDLMGLGWMKSLWNVIALWCTLQTIKAREPGISGGKPPQNEHNNNLAREHSGGPPTRRDQGGQIMITCMTLQYILMDRILDTILSKTVMFLWKLEWPKNLQSNCGVWKTHCDEKSKYLASNSFHWKIHAISTHYVPPSWK